MPRAGLSTPAVVEAAAAVADEIGWDDLTAAAVAAHVGVRVPSLYNHVDSLADLRRLVAGHATAQLCAELQRELAREPAGSGLASLTVLARTYLRWADAHPGRYPATLRAPQPGDIDHADVAARTIEVLRSALSGYGLAGSDVIHAIRLLRSTLHGLVTLRGLGGFGLPEPFTDTVAFSLAALDAGLRQAGSRRAGARAGNRSALPTL